MNIGLDYVPANRSLVAVDGAKRTHDRKRTWALLAADAVWAAPEASPLKTTALQDELPGAKVEPKRAAIRLAVMEQWITEEPGPQNSKLFRPGPVPPRKFKLKAAEPE